MLSLEIGQPVDGKCVVIYSTKSRFFSHTTGRRVITIEAANQLLNAIPAIIAATMQPPKDPPPCSA